MGNLKVRFLPDGGFGGTGAFIEYKDDAPNGDETPYQRNGPLAFNLICRDLKAGMSIGVAQEYQEVEERKNSRSISGKGSIESARGGQYSLSFLGEKSETHEVFISINESTAGEEATLYGVKSDDVLDIARGQYFGLELHVHRDRFAVLSKELSTPGAVLYIRVKAGIFPNFYAEWSPLDSNGRVIKFLDRVEDVENADEIPEDYWPPQELQRKMLSNLESPPVKITVGRPLQPPSPSPSISEGQEDEGKLDEDTPASRFQPMAVPVHDPIPAIEKLSKNLSRGAFWIGLWLALICAILVVQL